jgi:hypothetical protein
MAQCSNGHGQYQNEPHNRSRYHCTLPHLHLCGAGSIPTQFDVGLGIRTAVLEQYFTDGFLLYPEWEMERESDLEKKIQRRTIL